MGGIGCKCCNDCTSPGCSGNYEVPEGVRSAAFSMSAVTHPISVSPSFTFVRNTVNPSPCCSSAVATLNEVVLSDVFTNSYDMNDAADTEAYQCCYPADPTATPRLVQTLNTEVRKSGRSAFQAGVRYCDLRVSVCVDTQVIYGVPTCGIRVSVSLGFKFTSASALNYIAVARMQGTSYSYFTCNMAEIPYVSTVDTWKNCGGSTVTSWPSTPTMPSVSLTVDSCASGSGGNCLLFRNAFLPGVTSIPPGTVVSFPAQLVGTSGTCGGVLVFSPCAVQTGYWTPDTPDACGVPGFFPDQNFGKVCAGEPGGFCGSDIAAQRKLISRTRTQSQTMSHAVGTKIFDVFNGAWSLTL